MTQTNVVFVIRDCSLCGDKSSNHKYACPKCVYTCFHEWKMEYRNEGWISIISCKRCKHTETVDEISNENKKIIEETKMKFMKGVK